MEKWRNAIKCEKILLFVTGLFLCLLLALFFRDRAAMAASPVETENAVPQANFMPDISPVNVNTAAAEELAELPGVGDALARRMVDYRAEHGPFEKPEDLLGVSGIGEKKLAGLEGRIVFETD